MAVDVGEPEVPPAVTVGEPLMVKAEQVEDGRLEVVDVHAVLHRPETEVVRRLLA